ncbi:DUF4174 domain-containing protein [Aquicoccus sp. G2-2]|uniref:DUF4174 domain-containing protein n=1 Tax=Aquicoccus sp. G2-2 TaxID=3092120 RepID=UPI002AE0AA77|nr:DUF4174 domain-containing protein [Aquicoccus sp. G2-2]MEA1112898.1 DUF4174 domain-containing protein [Aquicoccus sp. G2-2]
MKRAISIVIAAFFASPALAQQVLPAPLKPLAAPSGTNDFTQFLWTKRPLVIFADNPNDPSFVEQMALLEKRPEPLAERDVVLLIDTDPAAKSALREKFRPHGFMLVLLGKDGEMYLRKPLPWDVRELSHSIDKMPLRLQEMRK